MKLNLKAFLLFLIIFALEIILALFVRDTVIRPYGGDLLVIILLHAFLQSFLNIKPMYLIGIVLCTAFLIEAAQFFHITEVLNIENKVLRTVIGTSFSAGDLVAYVLGALLCLPISKKIIG